MSLSQDTEYFYSLTPHLVLDAIEKIGVRCTGRALALNSMENRVYEVEIDNPGESEGPYANFRVAKFYRPGRWTKEQIQAEHNYLLALEANDIGVAPPLKFPKGETVAVLEGTNIFYAVFPKISGRCLDELSDEQLRQIGRLIARTHSIGLTISGDERIQLTPETYGKKSLEFLKEKKIIPPEIEPRITQLIEWICEISTPWFQRTKYSFIHGDCHLGNVLWDGERCFLVDFDDSVRGPFVQDLWLLTPGRDDESTRQRNLLIDGYEQMRPFAREDLALVEPLRALRMIYFTAWIARRWEDPAFQKVFTDFGSNQYWREQLLALEEQLVLIQGGSLQSDGY